MANAVINKDSLLYQMHNNLAEGDNINECLTCGACNSKCTWFDEQLEGHKGPLPRQIVRMALFGLDKQLVDSGMLWDCLLCNRCTENCPMGIDMDVVVRKARSLDSATKQVPADVQKGIQTRLEMGDVNGFTREDFFETVDWISEEFADDMEDPQATIPYDQPGAKYLYLPNPRELGLNLLHLTAMGKLFYAMQETWTMSSAHTDVTNWGYFVGQDDIMRQMALMVVEPAEELGIDTLVLSECGHGYLVLKVLLEELLGRKPAFKVTSIPELVLDYARKGVLKFDPGVHPFRAAYHDPCNMGRKSKVYDAPRELLTMLCEGVEDLTPCREDALCCGGGGGMIQDSSSTNIRMVAGKPKAEQMRATGLSNIATTCLSCQRQLDELCKHYSLGMKVHTVAAMASEALIIDSGN